MAGHELTNNDIKQGPETNQIRKHEVGTHDTRQRPDITPPSRKARPEP